MSVQTSIMERAPDTFDPSESDSDDELLRLAQHIADGQTLAVEDDLGTAEVAVLQQLRVLARVADAHHQIATEEAAGLQGPSNDRPRVETQRAWGELVLQEHRGSGAYGDVYRAWDPNLEREVALKIVSPRQSGADVSALLDEGKLLAKVKHPNVVTVFGAQQIGNEVGIWSEYLHGRNLSEIVERDGALGPTEAAMIGVNLCQALSAVHGSNLLHRDVKATNVIREKGGRIVLVDFGAGRRVESGGTDLHGTPLYMAPELFQGQPASVQTDVYSLGVLLYFLTTCSYPVRGESPAEIRAAHETGDRRHLRDARPDLPDGFVQVVERAIHPDPAVRFKSDGELEVALARSIGLGEVTGSRPGNSARPRKTVMALFWLAVIAALGGLGSWFFGPSQADPIERRAVIYVSPLENLTGQETNEHYPAALTNWFQNTLASVPGLVVVDSERGSPDQPTATHAVHGAVQQQDENLIVTLRLRDVANGTTIWSGNLEDQAQDYFSLQANAVTRLFEGMQLEELITEPQIVAVRESLREVPTRSSSAFSAYAEALTLNTGANLGDNAERAIALLERAIELDPDFTLAYAELAQTYWVAYRLRFEPALAEKATEYALEARRRGPALSRVHWTLALIYHGTGQLDRAKDELDKLISLQPASHSGYRLLARIASQTGDAAAALEAIDKALEIAPLLPANLATRGIVLLRAGRYTEATEAFLRETEVAGNDPDAWQRLAASFQYAGDEAQAIAAYERSIELGPTANAYTNLATIHFSSGDYSRAAETYEQAIELGPNSPVLYRNAGDAYDALGDGPTARARYLRAIELAESGNQVNPSDWGLVALRARCLAKLGRAGEARQILNGAIEQSTLNADHLLLLAATSSLLGDFSEAIGILERAAQQGAPISEAVLDADPDFAELRVSPQAQQLFQTSKTRKGTKQ